MKFHRCTHMNDRGKSTIHTKVEWRDSAGMLWSDDECSRCGRLWRYRVVPFVRHALGLAA